MTSRHVDHKLELLPDLLLFAACSRGELAVLGRELDMSTAPAGTALVALHAPVRHWSVLGRGTAAVSTVAGVTGLSSARASPSASVPSCAARPPPSP
jgi:hypothetical protein